MFKKETIHKGWQSIIAPLIAPFYFILIMTAITSSIGFSADAVKTISYHHSVTENGTIQVRLITEYIKGEKSLTKTYGKPMTPVDINDMTGWDDKSKDIVKVITSSGTLTAFEIEKNGVEINGIIYKHPSKIIGIGIEETMSFDRTLQPDCEISVRRIYRIFDNDNEISKRYHRNWIMPGDDPTGNDVISKAIAEKLHTHEVISAYKAKMAKQAFKMK